MTTIWRSALAGDCGVSAKFTAAVTPHSPASRLLQIGVCPADGSVKADAKCRSALARDCGVSAKFRSADTAHSPASRLLQIGVCPADGSVKADAKCRSALARDCGVSATFTSADTPHSPASRLLQIGVDAEISRVTTICRSRLAGERMWTCSRAVSVPRAALAGMSFYAVLINCTATLNIMTATIRSSRRHVVGRASQGASQAAPMASVENHNTEALAAPAT
jgi:hypothetical protein